MSHFYNDTDLYAAEWLRNLIKAGHLSAGDVNENDIRSIDQDLSQYRQCHFFAGIGGWSLALKIAGWPENILVWTGSCPCQPFSNAGKRKGTKDERHLWPEFKRLIEKHRPPVIFGEQVASKAGREWLSGVRSDLETLGYAVGAADLCAASAGTPHIRQRLFWVAYSKSERGCRWSTVETRDSKATGRSMPDLGYEARLIDGSSSPNVRISDVLSPAYGVSNRVGKLRAYGNAIVPQIAAEFIKAFMEAVGIE